MVGDFTAEAEAVAADETTVTAVVAAAAAAIEVTMMVRTLMALPVTIVVPAE